MKTVEDRTYFYVVSILTNPELLLILLLCACSRVGVLLTAYSISDNLLILTVKKSSLVAHLLQNPPRRPANSQKYLKSLHGRTDFISFSSTASAGI
jgi:hypothetical protein